MEKLTSFFYVISAFHRWGRGLDLDSARSFASVKVDKTEHYICQLVLKDCTTEEAETIGKFFFVTDWAGIELCHDCTDEDRALAKSKVVGWINTHCLTKEQKKKAEKQSELV